MDHIEELEAITEGTRISTDKLNGTVVAADEMGGVEVLYTDRTTEIFEPGDQGDSYTIVSTPLTIEAHQYYDDAGYVIGQAVQLPGGRGVMVYGHDYDDRPLVDGYLDIQLDMADDFASAEGKIRAHHELHITHARCMRCAASLEHEPNVGWVDSLSGDDGGTYDMCEGTPGQAHIPVGG
jgi:hypothetical protein